jgi:hypothetical protein
MTVFLACRAPNRTLPSVYPVLHRVSAPPQVLPVLSRQMDTYMARWFLPTSQKDSHIYCTGGWLSSSRFAWVNYKQRRISLAPSVYPVLHRVSAPPQVLPVLSRRMDTYMARWFLQWGKYQECTRTGWMLEHVGLAEPESPSSIWRETDDPAMCIRFCIEFQRHLKCFPC